jgi:hypothetical protein
MKHRLQDSRSCMNCGKWSLNVENGYEGRYKCSRSCACTSFSKPITYSSILIQLLVVIWSRGEVQWLFSQKWRLPTWTGRIGKGGTGKCLAQYLLRNSRWRRTFVSWEESIWIGQWNGDKMRIRWGCGGEGIRHGWAEVSGAFSGSISSLAAMHPPVDFPAKIVDWTLATVVERSVPCRSERHLLVKCSKSLFLRQPPAWKRYFQLVLLRYVLPVPLISTRVT